MPVIGHSARFLIASLTLLAAYSSLDAAPRKTLRRDLQYQAGIVSAEFLYTKASFPQCHASTIAETDRGLVAAFFGGTHENNPDVGIWVCRKDQGMADWTPPFEVANGIQHSTLRYPTWNPVLVQAPSGPLLLFYKAGPHPKNWWGMLTTSDDGGVTWTRPRRLPEGIAGPIKNKPIWLSDGSLLCGSSTEDNGWRVHFERTGDLGLTWQRTPALHDGRAIGAIQPTILRHADGRLQALCRTRGVGRVAEFWSGDEGQTWSAPALTNLPNPNAGFDGVTLRDGRHLLVYNHTTRETGGRSKLHVAVSRDGHRWQAALRLEDTIAFDGRKASGHYPAVIQTRDGLVHTVYTWKRETVQHVVMDPRKLHLRDMLPDGGWPPHLSDIPVPEKASLRGDLMRQPGVVSAEFAFTEAPFRRCHASTVAETEDAIVTAYFGGHEEGHPSVGIWVSRKEGKDSSGTWSAPVEVADGHQPSGLRFPCWNPVLYQRSNGPLLLFYKIGPSPKSWWGMLRTSSDQGKTWSEPTRLPDRFCGPVRAKPVLLDDGRLLCGASTEHTGWRVHMEWTTDFGKTWERTEALNGGRRFAAIQPTILTRPSGLSILCRSDNHLREATSTDQGRTWTPLEISSLPNPSAGVDVVNLRDGRHLLVYNHSTRKTGGRSHLNVAVSSDGKTWKAALKLEDDTTITGGTASGSYPAAIQASSGLVHITYSWRYRAINHVVIDPARLQLQEMPDGKWPQ